MPSSVSSQQNGYAQHAQLTSRLYTLSRPMSHKFRPVSTATSIDSSTSGEFEDHRRGSMNGWRTRESVIMESAAEDYESEDSESESIRSLGARARMMTEMLSDSDGSIGRRSMDGGLTFSLSEYDESFDVPSTPPALPEYSSGNFQMVEISDEKSSSVFRSYSLSTPPASSHDSICTIGPKGPHLFRSFSTSHQNSLPHITIPRLSTMMPPTPAASVSPASPPALPSPSQFQQPASAIDESLPYLFREPEVRPVSELSQVVSDYDIDEIRSWTPRQVCAWMTALNVERDLVDKFERNDISGAILIDLKWEDLKELDIQSFGKRIELWSEIHHLRTRTASSPIAGEPIPRASSRMSRRSSPRTSPVPTPKSSPRIPQTPMGRGSSHSVNEIPLSERRQEKEITEREDSSDEERAPRPPRTQIRKRARRTTARVPKSKHYDSMASESAGMSDADSAYLHQVKYMPSIRAVEESANRQNKVHRKKKSNTVGPNDSISVVSKSRRNKNIEDFTSFGPNTQNPKGAKLHKCSKGENCRKHGQPVSSKSGEKRRRAPAEHGTIFIATTPSIADASALPRLSIFDGASRPVSVVAPSIIASSDVLGPSQRREVQLKQNTLKDVGRMDPLENVKQFLTLQHLQHLEERRHSPPPVPTKSAEDLARAHLRGVMPPMASPPLSRSESAPPPPTSSHSSNGSVSIPIGLSNSPPMASPPIRSMTPMSLRTMGMERVCPPEGSPPMSMRSLGTNMMRTTTPFSEADVPIYSTTPPPDNRNQSQSVPPDMRYRRFATPDRAQFNPTPLPTTPTPVPVRRGTVSSPFRPAPVMTAVDENAEWELVEDDEDGAKMAPAPSPQKMHSGWMKKRRTNWFRHEWPDYHFVLKGTRLGYARHMEKEDGFIEMDNYSVACSTTASHKLSAAFKGSKLFGKKGGKEGDCGAYFFQLVPAAPEPGKSAIGKVHHFAVGSREERIDWMRELMLAKAIKQKKEGFEVAVNGEKV